MKCPKCSSEMTFYQQMDEYEDGTLYQYAQWECPTLVEHMICDYEDDFEWPAEEG